MPTGKYYHKQSGRWVKKNSEQAFDYEACDPKAAGLLISFFRWYPDYFLDMIESENSDYSLELPQRLILRAFARYRQSDITGCRGLTKTFCNMLGCMTDGVLWAGEIMRYYAPSKQQAAELAATAFHQIEKNYPALAACWKVRSETKDLFKIETDYGSQLQIGAIQGGNCSQITAEEIGQETEPKFDFNDFESKVLPINRLERKVNQIPDKTHINNKIKIITNASSRANPAYHKYHNDTMRTMIQGAKYEAFCVDIGWEIALICNLRSKQYVEKLKRTMSAEDFLRQMCARYTGVSENPLIADDVLARSRKMFLMEEKHSGEKDVIYIVSHDVAYENNVKNAKCADTVLKLSKYSSVYKRDKYRKQVVYVDSYPPPKTAYLQAEKLKNLYFKYCNNEAQTTYLVVDARAVGKDVVDELMKPTNDGTPALCCYKHMAYTDMEQPHSLPVIYPLKAGTRGTTDEEGQMIRYAQLEFEQGNVELLTSNLLDGVEQYKKKHRIKDELSNARIIHPYKKTDELCDQIHNLTTEVSGLTLKEVRRSKAIQRDDWSSLKYALRMAQILESELIKEAYTPKASWDSLIKQHSSRMTSSAGGQSMSAKNERQRLLGLRKNGK